MLIVRCILAAIILLWTFASAIWPSRDNGQILYYVASVLSIMQFIDHKMTKWCLAVFSLGIFISILFPVWSKP